MEKWRESVTAVGADEHVRGVAEQHRGEWWAEAILSLMERLERAEGKCLCPPSDYGKGCNCGR